ncbi:MAG: AAA family ATPase [Anaerolineales bacterium]
MAVVTISRQYGSGGTEIAAQVCEVLGYTHFNKNTMVDVADEMDISEDEVVDFSEDTYKVRGFLDRLLGRRRMVVPAPEAASDEDTIDLATLDATRGVELVKKIILGAYDRGNVVIVGRGGQSILQEKYGVLHVRIEAPLGARALHIKERQGISMEAARQLALEKDQAAAAYVRNFFNIAWDNSKYYHLVINTGKWEISAAAQIIVNALSHMRQISELKA